jgi:hypothetical protein
MITSSSILHNWLVTDDLKQAWVDEAKKYEKNLAKYFVSQSQRDMALLSATEKD